MPFSKAGLRSTRPLIAVIKVSDHMTGDEWVRPNGMYSSLDQGKNLHSDTALYPSQVH